VKPLNLSRSSVRAGSRAIAALEHRLHVVGHQVASWGRQAPVWFMRMLHTAPRAALRELPRQALLLPGRIRRLPRGARAALWIGIIAIIALWEMQTSSMQARILSTLGKTLTYSVEQGPSPRIVFPREGPWDERRGYTRVAEFSRRLERKGYRLVSQARFSRPLALAARSGVTPPQPEPSEVGLVIQGAGGDTLYDAVRGSSHFQSFEEIPPLVVQSLLFVENRELAKDTSGTVNPAVDWGRFFKAIFLYAGRHVGLPVSSEGGSTLAVQLEKYRHSPEGRTGSAPEKLRQMLTASLRAYHAGAHTGEARRQIILDYVNSVPLGGVPGFGEVFGLSEGLEVWFGLEPGSVRRELMEPTDPARYAQALKAVLSLLCAVRAPTYYLAQRGDALEERVASYTRLLNRAGILDWPTSADVRAAPIPPRRTPAAAWENSVRVDQGTGRVREELRALLGVRDNYALDRIHVTVEATLEPGLQRDVSAFFRGLSEGDTLEERGLTGDRLVGASDPAPIVYSLLVCERTPAGNFVRVEEDNVPGALDFNRGTMLELGSTAKLRTLVHYLDLVSREHAALAGRDAGDLAERAETARDPITRWVAGAMIREPDAPLDSLLQRALERDYSASPGEVFFTGGGLATFRNFDSDDDDKRFTVREAAVRSNNLAFIRLMRDLVAYHAARLPYDPTAVLSGDAKGDRDRLLREIAVAEGESPDTSWLLRTGSRHAQDLRLRARVERDAFDRMAEDWRRIGFPFPRLVPSYATALGSSADQPGALADLMAVLLNDGHPLPTHRIRRVTFAPGTPYETTYEALPAPSGGRVLDPAVARAVRGVLADVVERGTGRRIRGAFVDSSDVAVEIGGKTGTGDNRVERVGRGGRMISSRAVSRTATFVFYLEDRYYGVITASVLGPEASSYRFTSALPVSILRQLAPDIEKRLHIEAIPTSVETSMAQATDPRRHDPDSSTR
jgi:membrane peptidoglycan carboxypeptidase